MEPWRQQIREAEEAFREGQLEEASCLMRRFDLERYRPGQQLAQQLATAFSRRGLVAAKSGDLANAWHDLNESRLMAPSDPGVVRARAELVELTLAAVRQALTKGNLGRAEDALRQFQRFNLADYRTEPLQQAIAQLHQSRSLSDEGRFVEATRRVEAAIELLPELEGLRALQRELESDRRLCRDLTEQLRKSMTACDWQQAIGLADELLELAPRYQIARDARQICTWSQAGKMKPNRRDADPVLCPGPPQASRPPSPSRAERAEPRTEPAPGMTQAVCPESTRSGPIPPRFLLWVDGVGGYLVCWKDRVMVGQALPEDGVDIPIQGDLSRRHARIERIGEDYLLEPLAAIAVNGRSVTDRTLLNDGDLLEFGHGVRLQFRRPHALSGTGKLEFVSRHRTHPWADGILLLADSCVLGPRGNSHIVCEDWQEEVVLFRRKGLLFCRGPEAMEVDGRIDSGDRQLHAGSRISGEDFAMTLEPLEERTA